MEQLEPRQSPRFGPGWAVFFAVVGLLTALQLLAYLDRGQEPDTRRAGQTSDRMLRMTLNQHAAVGALFRSSAPKLNLRDLRRELPKLESAGATQDEAIVAIAIRMFVGDEPAKLSLETLGKSKEEPYKRVLQLVENPPRAEPGVRSLGTDLPKLFSAKLIWALALEKAGVENARDEVISVDAGRRLLLLTIGLVAGLALGVIAWISYFVARATGGLVRPELPAMSDGEADARAGKATQILILFFMTPLLVAMIVRGEAPLAARILLPLIVIAGSFWLLRQPVFGQRIEPRNVGLHRELPVGKGLLWTAGALVAEIPLLATLAAVSVPLQRFFPPAEHPITVRLAEQQSDPMFIFTTLLMASVMAPIVEELIFRGLVAPALVRLLRSTALGLILAALLFAVIHPTGIPAWLPLAGVGFMSSLLYLHTRSLWPSMLFHAIHNSVILGVTLAVFS